MIAIIILVVVLAYLIYNTKKKILYRTVEYSYPVISVHDGLYYKKALSKKKYLIRWTVIKNKWFSIKLHKALMSDPEDLHDHPWSFITILLWGGYFEMRQKSEANSDKLFKWYGAGSILYRDGSIPHKLIIPKDKYCLSLIFTSYRWREWGFIRNGKWQKATNNSY